MSKKLPLTCPCALKKPLQKTATGYACTKGDCEHARSEAEFKINENVPLLISETRCDTVCTADFGKVYVDRSASHLAPLKYLFTGGAEQTRANCAHFIAKVLEKNSNPKVLVIGYNDFFLQFRFKIRTSETGKVGGG